MDHLERVKDSLDQDEGKSRRNSSNVTSQQFISNFTELGSLTIGT